MASLKPEPRGSLEPVSTEPWSPAARNRGHPWFLVPLRSSLLRWGKAEIQAVLAAEYWSQVHTEKEIGRVGRKLVSKMRDCVLRAATSSRRLQLVHQMSHLLQTLAHRHSHSSHTRLECRRTRGEPLHAPRGCSESSYPTTSYSLAETRQRAVTSMVKQRNSLRRAMGRQTAETFGSGNAHFVRPLNTCPGAAPRMEKASWG